MLYSAGIKRPGDGEGRIHPSVTGQLSGKVKYISHVLVTKVEFLYKGETVILVLWLWGLVSLKNALSSLQI